MINLERKPVIIVAVLAVAAILIAATPWTSRQHKAHQIAELARELGLPEDGAIIAEASRVWWAEQEDARIIANVIAHEAPYCTARHQQLVAQVILNRVADPRFPDTVREVIEQPGQYHPSYTQSLPTYSTASPEELRCFDAAVTALMGGVDCPADVIFQSQYSSLGAGVYEKITVDTGAYRSTTFFNFG